MIRSLDDVWQTTPYPEVLSEAYWEGKRDFVPILSDESAVALTERLALNKPRRVLEIGTAIGYSGLLILGVAKGATLTTIDVDSDRLERARHYFEKAGVKGRVQVIEDDALKVLPMMDMTFDYIFLDGPKGHYPEMLDDLLRLLTPDGEIYVDDVNYLGLVEGEAKVLHKHRTIVTKMREFVESVKEKQLDKTVLPIAGGAMWIRKK